MLDLFKKKQIKTLKDTINSLELENISLRSTNKELEAELTIAKNCCKDSDHNNLILLKNAEELRNQIANLEKIIKSQQEDYEALKTKITIEPEKIEIKPKNIREKKETISKKPKKSKK